MEVPTRWWANKGSWWEGRACAARMGAGSGSQTCVWLGAKPAAQRRAFLCVPDGRVFSFVGTGVDCGEGGREGCRWVADNLLSEPENASFPRPGPALLEA